VTRPRHAKAGKHRKRKPSAHKSYVSPGVREFNERTFAPQRPPG
jgi:hypothetical protein